MRTSEVLRNTKQIHIRKGYGATDTELISDVKKTARKLGHNYLSRREYTRNGTYHSNTFVKRFGSWGAALKLAKLGRAKSSLKLSKEELFKNIEHVWHKLGRQPKRIDIRRPLSKYCFGTYENHFGSWRKALLAFARYVNTRALSPGQKGFTRVRLIRRRKRRGSRIIAPTMRLRVLHRDHYKCNYCGRSPAKDPSVVLHIDHKLPWSRGGTNEFKNLQVLCSACNFAKHNKMMEEL
jgi:hypothetical protein